MRFRPIAWEQIPDADKAVIRYTCRALPAYDLSLSEGWEYFDTHSGKRYAVNRSLEWYVAHRSSGGVVVTCN